MSVTTVNYLISYYDGKDVKRFSGDECAFGCKAATYFDSAVYPAGRIGIRKCYGHSPGDEDYLEATVTTPEGCKTVWTGPALTVDAIHAIDDHLRKVFT